MARHCSLRWDSSRCEESGRVSGRKRLKCKTTLLNSSLGKSNTDRVRSCPCQRDNYSFQVIPSRRNFLPHTIPSWVDPCKEVYFITITCKQRHHNQLASAEITKPLLETVRHREEKFIWWPHVFLLMPDHLHALLSFPLSERPIWNILTKWKEWTAKQIGVSWQDDFFEHRLRRGESRRQKADYILANPVRANLVSSPEDWPYVHFGGAGKPQFTD